MDSRTSIHDAARVIVACEILHLTLRALWIRLYEAAGPPNGQSASIISQQLPRVCRSNMP